MKKLLLAFFAAALFSTGSFAQTFDLGVIDVTVFDFDAQQPIAPGSDITAGTNILIAFTVENFGDTVPVGDTLTFLDVTTGFQDFPLATVVDTAILPGETITYFEPGEFSTQGVAAGAFEVCLSHTTTGDADNTNDETCVQFNMVDPNTSIEEIAIASDLYFANNALFFNLNTQKNTELTVFDVSGKTVVQTTVAPGTRNVQLNDVPNGIYLVRMEAGSESVTKKIAKF